MLLTNTHSTINTWAINLRGTPTSISVNADVIIMCNSFIDRDEGTDVAALKMEGRTGRSRVSEEKFIGDNDIAASAFSPPATADRSCICDEFRK